MAALIAVLAAEVVMAVLLAILIACGLLKVSFTTRPLRRQENSK